MPTSYKIDMLHGLSGVCLPKAIGAQWQDIATCCLFLAGKVEETPFKLRDVILLSERIRSQNKIKLDPDSKVWFHYEVAFRKA
jgi:hypothetical protein